MRKKLLFSLLTLILTTAFSYGQMTVSGTVRGASGETLPGVSIQVKGTNQGTATDFDGAYEISASQGDVLVFSFVGFATKEVVVSDATLHVTLQEDTENLEEVVVTALGIQREEKALGYSLTSVDGDEMTQVKTTNAMNALQGRVAGVNVSGNSTGASGSSRVIIRGASSLTGNNQPLYVIDGIPMVNQTKGSVGKFDGEFGDGGDDISGVNPDDIESVSVLKGSSAAALYGSAASNGVIMITTKSGKGTQGLGIEFSSSLTFDKVNTDLQDFQTTYGQGTYGVRPGFERDDDGNIVPIVDPEEAVDDALVKGLQSWGERYDGAPTIQFDGINRPYSYSGDNVERFYNVGSTAINTLSLVKGAEDYNYRFSVTNLDNDDVFPNSTLKRQSYSFNAMAKINPRLTSTVSGRYIIEKVHNRVGIGDGPGNANFTALLLPGNVNIKDLKPGYDETGNGELDFQSSVWFTNPYWVTNKFKNDDKKNRLIGSATLKYDITDWLYATGRAGIDRYDMSRRRITPYGTAYRPGGRHYQNKSTFDLFDADIMLGIDKDLTDKISTNSVIGANTQKQTYQAISAQGDNYVVIGLEDLNNTTNPLPVYSFWEKQKNSIYGSFELAWDNWAYLTYTGRNEWFSSLSFPGKTTPNSDYYWSLSGSVLLNDAFDMGDAVNYFKLRSSYAQVAGDTGAYQLNLDYSVLGTFQGNAFGQINGSTIPNPNLVPLQKTEFEVGLEGRFFSNRLRFDLALYDNTTTNDIVRASATPTSGFTGAMLNVGELQNRGIEFLIGGYPIKNDDFSWNISYNMGYNDSEIVATNEEGNLISMQQSRSETAYIQHRVGEHYGTIAGFAYKKDDAGNIIYHIDGNGIPRPEQGELMVLGQGVAPLNMGLSNSFNYKGIGLSFLIDAKFGGQVYSGTNAQAYVNGRHKETLKGREDGLVVTGVDTDGNPFNVMVEPRNLQSYYLYYWDKIAEEFIFDSDFIKFRELSLSYNFPKNIIGDKFVQDLKISLIGRNLFYIMKEVENIDPEASLNNTNAQGLERFGVPSTRSYGFSVNVKF